MKAISMMEFTSLTSSCWLDSENGTLWVFLGPVTIITSVNISFFFGVVVIYFCSKFICNCYL